MEADGEGEAIRPVTVEEEAVKRNTDCVYFLASPLTCKKGSECEYRHSDGARINHRDCWYWLNGNCLNQKCSFRHPPLDSLFTTPLPASGPVPPPQNGASTRIPAVCAPPNNINKQNVPCYYFQWGQCLKGERCPFMHGPQVSSSSGSVSQQVATASTSLAEPPHSSKNDAQLNITVQHNVNELNKPKVTLDIPVDMPPAMANLVAKHQVAAKNRSSKKKISPPYLLDDQPLPLPQNVVPVSSSNSLRKPWSHQVQPLDEQLEDGRDTDEFFLEHSPGFDVLVEDDIKDSDYFHNENNFRRVSAHDGQNMEPENDYDYHHSDYETMTNSEKDRCNGASKYDNYETPCGRYGWESKMSGRILDKSSSLERRVLGHDRKFDEMDGSDLRHRLKQRKFTGSKSTENPDGCAEKYQRDDSYVEERDYGYHARDQRQVPRENSISTRLQGRITFPGRSSTDMASNLHLEKDRSRKHRGRLSPIRQINYQERHAERIRKQPEDFSRDTTSIKNKPTRRDDANSLDFAGPKSLAELKGPKINASSHEQSIRSTGANTKLNKVESGKVEELKKSEISLSFEGPKPLSVILKRKRESANMDSNSHACQYENNQGGGESAVNNSVPVSLQSVPPSEAGKEGNHRLNSHEAHKLRAVGEEVQEEEEEEGMIPTDDEELIYDGQYSAKNNVVGTVDGMYLENVEDEELENYDQRDEDFDYEAGEIKAEDGENSFQDDEEFDDEDDFARKVSVMLS